MSTDTTNLGAARAITLWRARVAPLWAFLRGPYPTLVSRLVVGGVFLLTGVLKALDVTSFARSIRAYQIVPEALVPIMANGLPWLEIALGAYVLAGLYRRWSALATGALLVIFMIAMGQAMARGLTLQCGCFGTALSGAALREDVNIGSILRDGVWLLMAAHLYFVPSIWTADDYLARRGRLTLADAPAPEVPPPSTPAPSGGPRPLRRERGAGARARRRPVTGE
jgi:uncharacterized membrane protein YphA (DoxX/SURF4 family)